MARIGMNPARNRVSNYSPARVTAAVLVYIPYLHGYFEHRMEVLKLCLGSIIKNTEEPYDLLVFDNGSCPEVKAYLKSLLDSGDIRYLITSSENIGKIGAFDIIFKAAPGEVVAFCDDDIFFYPGWLREHLQLLDSYPDVGMVSGCAVRTLFDHATSSNVRLAETDPDTTLERGQFTKQEWEIAWADSYGRDVEAHLEALKGMEDMVIERHGVKAFAVANHNQFLIPKDVIKKFLPEEWSGRLMGQMVELDNAVDGGGYLRLSTLDRTTQHMGNLVSSWMAEEAQRYGVSAEASQLGSRRAGSRFWSTVLRWKPVHWLLQGLYNRLFWILSDQTGGWLQPKG